MHYPSPTLYFGLHWSEQLRVAPVIELTDVQEGGLTRLAQGAQIVLLAAQGLQNKDIAQMTPTLRTSLRSRTTTSASAMVSSRAND